MKKTTKISILLIVAGLIIGGSLAIGTNVLFHCTSTNESCNSCHIHPDSYTSWKKSVHYNSTGGVSTDCVECHLPPSGTREYYTAKVKTGLKDIWSYTTKDSSEINWAAKNELEHAQKFVYNKSCVKCHTSIFPARLSDDGVTAHLYYEENAEKLDLQCISCHLNVGHYDPNYSHSKLSTIPTARKENNQPVFEAATEVSGYVDFTEKIPGTTVSFNMKAIPGGTFKMGSPSDEQLRKDDEGPIRDVTLSPFLMSEIEVTWDQYWAFFAETLSEGRTLPAKVYANNESDPAVDAISGPTPPFGIPDQGWGAGDRPAITMTPYAAEIFCMWLSKKTGKKYRLPTEAEWEYAVRGGTTTPYFFEGNPKQYYSENFWNKWFGTDTTKINSYVIYMANSQNRTNEPSAVMANTYGLKNMLGNVMEYCADKYATDTYSKTPSTVTNPINKEGDEFVVRGGDFRSDADILRSASRGSTEHDKWLKTDPQQPKSIWWYSDIKSVGFRVVCTLD